MFFKLYAQLPRRGCDQMMFLLKYTQLSIPKTSNMSDNYNK